MTGITQTKLAAYLAVIFVAGAVSGSVITLRKAQAKSQPPSMEKVCHKMQDRLRTSLELTSEQSAEIQPILDRTAQEIKKIHSRTMQEIEAAICRGHEQLAKHLNPQQRLRLDQLDADRRDWLAKRQRARDANGK